MGFGTRVRPQPRGSLDLVVYCIENLFILCVLVMVWVVRKSISNFEEANLNLLIRYINRTMLEKFFFFNFFVDIFFHKKKLFLR